MATDDIKKKKRIRPLASNAPKLGGATKADRHREFARAVVRCKGNATQAAILLGYSKKSARSQASRLLSHVTVQDELHFILRPRLERLEVTADKVLAELASLGFSNMADYVKLEDGSVVLDFPDEGDPMYRVKMAAVEGIEQETYFEKGDDGQAVKKTKFKLANKKGALDTMAKVLGMIRERHEHTGKDGGPIQTEGIDLTDMDQKDRDALRGILERKKQRSDDARTEGK
jgi:phage terminase small subunit